MSSKQKSRGVLNEQYAIGRLRSPELRFRLKTRARAVTMAVKKFSQNSFNLEILDFGAAEGKTLLELNKLLPNSQFCGIEYSKELSQSAKSLPINIRVIYGDVLNASKLVENQSFDVVIASAFLEHLPDPLDAIKEAVKVLKINGLFIATCPVPFWDYIAHKIGLLKANQHESYLNRKKLKLIVKKAKLELVEFKKFMWAPISFLPYLKIPFPVLVGLYIDGIVERIKVFNWLYINQLVIGRKVCQ